MRRAHLEATYPDHPEIWHNRPDDKSKSREYKEDINSRPLFANHMGANAIIHLHTNASTNPLANGTQAFFSEGQAESQKLADNILCGMNEVIHSKEEYKNFKVENKARAGKHGENSNAKMPSALIEVGFHTNPGDAALIKDIGFRSIAMEGIAKGYWIYSLGKTCVPFEAISAADVEAAQDENTTVPVIVNIHGFPRSVRGKDAFAVDVLVEPVSCPNGTNCRPGSVTASSKEPDGPYEYRHTCAGPNEKTFTARYRVTLKDRDNVVTAPVEYNVTCQPNGPIRPGWPANIFVIGGQMQSSAG